MWRAKKSDEDGRGRQRGHNYGKGRRIQRTVSVRVEIAKYPEPIVDPLRRDGQLLHRRPGLELQTDGEPLLSLRRHTCTLQAKGLDSREGRAGNACSCAGGLQSCRTSPRRRAGWPALCTAGCRERERVAAWIFSVSIGTGTIHHLVSALGKQQFPNTHFLHFHTTLQNNEKRLQSRKTRSVSLFLCTGKKWNYVWAKKNPMNNFYKLHVFKEKLLLAVNSVLWKM